MSNVGTTTKVFTVLLSILIVAVAGLGYMVFQTNYELRALAAVESPGNPNGTEVEPGVSTAIKPKRDTSMPPDPFSLPSEPFDPNGWDPFREMDTMHRRIDAMFDNAFRRFRQLGEFESMKEGPFTPRMDLTDKGDRYVVQLDIPGAEGSEINVTVRNDTLTVETETRVFNETENEADVLQRERRVGRFMRQIALPEPVDEGSMDTKYEDGVFTVTIDKAATGE